MSEIEALREELEQTKLAYQMAVQMSQFKEGFLARTAHELRSPLSSLIGLHQLILSDLCESPEEEREFLEQAYHSALKLMKLIDEVVVIAKIEHGTSRLNIEPVQLAPLFSEVNSFTSLQAANRNLGLQVSSPDPSLYILADRARLLQVLVNLVDCGISLLEEGTIAVSANAPKKSNSIQIQIDLPCSSQIWKESGKLLQQTPKATIEEIKSFGKKLEFSPGMKLLLSQTILETMNGRLDLIDDFKDNSFTRLQCLLPVAPPEILSRMLRE